MVNVGFYGGGVGAQLVSSNDGRHRFQIEGELRYREYTPAESDRSVRVAEIHAQSILALDRSERQPGSATEAEPADEPLD